MPSPPKPWERAGNTASAMPLPSTATTSQSMSATTTATSAPSSSSAGATPAASSSSSTTPSVPARPAAITSGTTTQPTYTQSAYNSPYGYSSPYSRLGNSYSPYGSTGMYGGMGLGSYGGAYGMSGMYGGGMGGMGGYGGLGGMPYGPMNPYDANNPAGGPSLSQTLSNTTQHTFALLHSIVQTFSGVAQMLESTFMATHSSFFAMVGVVEQFAMLRNALGSVLGLFGLIKWLKGVLTGQRGSPELRHEFREFINGRPVHGPAGPPQPTPSKKPIIVFLAAVVGIPYAMHKLIQLLSSRAEQQAALPQAALQPLTPTDLTFARALYPFTPSSPSELALKVNEIVAIMGKLDPTTGQEVDPRVEVPGCEWWKGRTREGREGWFPKKWVEVLEKKGERKQDDLIKAEPKMIEGATEKQSM
ncbi:hypothetical protein NEOLEDRAFT_1135922 [Neolentinus lepideus HHB14362 ss-1]|uniref:Peroxisomal membrane protein PEX13 n=1 Tax=Neolentinus lepideus HHB14362 ss-1 TaxID=1314782 RepID=A0A165RGU0_9AGAM|nr:hypothetical protein NEOLEDRAFT_1135922 [Neolentinus lepideus HHB14362 ss-1]